MSERPVGSDVRSMWSTRNFRRLVIGLLAVGILAVVVWLLVPVFTTSEGVRDARTVFCTQRSERVAFADAAVALGVVDGSTADVVSVGDAEIPVISWRKGHEGDFDRACDALVAMRSAPVGASTPGVSVFQPFLLALLTAALTFVSTSRKDRRTRSQTEGDALRDNVRSFADATNAYLDGFVGFPARSTPGEMNNTREELLGRLRGVHGRHSSWQALGDVIARLNSGELRSPGDELSRIQNARTRADRIDALKAQVAEVVAVGHLAANALADPTNADPRLRQRLIEASTR